MYKRRHYYGVPGPSQPVKTRSGKSGVGGGGGGVGAALYRKRFNYTELKDMNNDD